jgi:hypothetical protein
MVLYQALGSFCRLFKKTINKEYLYMSVTTKQDGFKNFVITSPYFFVIFLFVPGLIVAGRFLPLPRLPFITTNVILLNNLCFLICIAQRFIRTLICARREVRYGEGYRAPRSATLVEVPAEKLRAECSAHGYMVADGGRYAEKRDIGYIGTVIIYGGLLFLLSVGMWENLNQFSGTLLMGVGNPKSLAVDKTYLKIIKGAMATASDLPKLQILRQILPNAEYPLGATEIALSTDEGAELSKGIIEPYKPIHYKNYDINLAKYLFDANISISFKDNKYLFSDFVKLQPLVKKKGKYSYFSGFTTGIYGGEIYYEPSAKELNLILSKDGKTEFDTALVFQNDTSKTIGDYIIKFDKLGQWSEIHVSRRRHVRFIVMGGIAAAMGVLLRLLIRPQRIWFADAGAEVCQVKYIGSSARRLIEGLRKN